MKVGGVVLAGGRSQRIGTPKAWLPLGGEFALQRVVRIVGAVVDPVVVAAREGQPLPPLPASVTIVADVVDGAGPVAGIAAGLMALRGRCDAAFVAACDHALLRREVIARLVESLGDAASAVSSAELAAVVIAENEGYPMLGVFRVACGEIAVAMLREPGGTRRMQDFSQRCGAVLVGAAELRSVDPELDSLRNINDAGAYQEAMKRMGRSG